MKTDHATLAPSNTLVVALAMAALVLPAMSSADEPPSGLPVEVGVQPAAHPASPPQQGAGHESPASARGTADGVVAPHNAHGSLAEVGAKLSNPISDVWAHFTEFTMAFNDGDVNDGDPEIGGGVIYQPILPVPIYGKGKDEWRLIVRPTIPLLLGQPVPQGPNSFDNKTGIGDTLLPLPLSAPTGSWILALGPTFLLPTSTKDSLGDQQWGAGPAGVFGYKNKTTTLVAFPQYHFGIGGRGDRGGKSTVSKLSLLYAAYLNLPDAWQVGMNPTINYNDKASSGNKWNVPLGLLVAKTVAIGGRPVKFQFGFEYSVVSEDDFGKRMLFKLNVIPVVGALIKNPIFGGD